MLGFFKKKKEESWQDVWHQNRESLFDLHDRIVLIAKSMQKVAAEEDYAHKDRCTEELSRFFKGYVRGFDNLVEELNISATFMKEGPKPSANTPTLPEPTISKAFKEDIERAKKGEGFIIEGVSNGE